ncbi:MAG: TIGR00282 family metallophosphoesterase [SAR202 cluster bacterium]|nr:TIGR00282 family metallophosphoesterase [SAR202 cluster bacterium]
MRVLMVGDVVGRPGRHALATILPDLRKELALDFAIVQGENIAAGFGLTLDTVKELLAAGADVVTTGNHVWDRNEFITHLNDRALPVIRPMNYPPSVPGRGFIDLGGLVVVNLIGRVFLGEFDSPFAVMEKFLKSHDAVGRPVLVDFHAEATSEKQAMGYFLDGRVAALVGTHTHVATADQRILPKGTAYVTDLGMVGPMDSVIGMEVGDALFRFLNNMPRHLRVAEGACRFNSVMIELDDQTGQAVAIERIDRETTH